jgi:hypothetical protein
MFPHPQGFAGLLEQLSAVALFADQEELKQILDKTFGDAKSLRFC